MKIYSVTPFKQFNHLLNKSQLRYTYAGGALECPKSGSFYADFINLFKTYCQRLGSEITPIEALNNLSLSQISKTTLKYIASSELEKMLKYPRGRMLYLVTGRPGSGKTTIVRNLQFNKEFYVPDADDIKSILPYYKEKGATYVHKASCIINSQNLDEALKRGINSVLQTATTFENLDEIIRTAKNYGYKIKLIHLNVNEKTAIERCSIRASARGRSFSLKSILERKYLDEIVSTYSRPKKGISEIFVYENNGRAPVLVDHIKINKTLS